MPELLRSCRSFKPSLALGHPYKVFSCQRTTVNHLNQETRIIPLLLEQGDSMISAFTQDPLLRGVFDSWGRRSDFHSRRDCAGIPPVLPLIQALTRARAPRNRLFNFGTVYRALWRNASQVIRLPGQHAAIPSSNVFLNSSIAFTIKRMIPNKYHGAWPR